VKNNNIDRIVFKYDPADGTVIAFLPDEAAPPWSYRHLCACRAKQLCELGILSEL